MVLDGKIGFEFCPFTFEIERGKVMELAMAIGDPNPLYQKGEALPPTFGTVIDMWGVPGFYDQVNKLELNIQKVLHGEQEFEYLGKINIGEKLTGVTKVLDVQKKANMDLIKLETKYKNEEGKVVLISRNTLIERQ